MVNGPPVEMGDSGRTVRLVSKQRKKRKKKMFRGEDGRCLPVGVKTADEAADSVPPGVMDRVSAETVTVTMPTVSVLTMVEAGASAAVTVT